MNWDALVEREAVLEADVLIDLSFGSTLRDEDFENVSCIEGVQKSGDDGVHVASEPSELPLL